jgi:hypothetical protein
MTVRSGVDRICPFFWILRAMSHAVGPLAPPPYGRSLGRLAIRKWGVGPDWVLDPRAGLVLAGAHSGGLSGVMGGYQQD